MEHRWGVRYLLDVSIRLEGRLNLLVFARLRNASSSGAYVETPVVPTLESRVWVELGSPPSRGGDRCRIPAYVVRRDGRGVGLEWCEFAPRPVLALIETTWRAEISERRADHAASEALQLAGGEGARHGCDLLGAVGKSHTRIRGGAGHPASVSGVRSPLPWPMRCAGME